jgi:ribosome-associated protein
MMTAPSPVPQHRIAMQKERYHSSLPPPDRMPPRDARPSKSQRKRQMLALQDLGAELSELSRPQLDALALPENLRDALLEARRISGFEARRRHMQYVGKLMRGIDPDPIRTQLEAWKAPARRHAAMLARAEFWRERVLAEEDAVALFCEDHPHADARQLSQLVQAVRRERELNRPPASYRALYRLLREALLAQEGGREERGERREG